MMDTRAGEPDDLHLLIATAWRRLPFLVVSGLLVGGALFVLSERVPPRFSAEATLMLQPRSSTADREQQILAIPDDGSSLSMLARTEAAVAASLPTAMHVISGLSEADRAALVGAEPGVTPTPEAVVAAYRNAVVVSNAANTLLIHVDATAPTAALAARLATEHAEAYAAVSAERRRAEADRLLSTIDAELALIDQAETDARAEVARIRAGGPELALDAPDVAIGRLSGLLAAIEEAKATVVERELDLKSAEIAGPFELGADLSSITALQLQVADVLSEIAAISRFSSSSPELLRLESRRDALMQAARDATAGIVDAKRDALVAARDRLAALEGAATAMQTQIRDSEAARIRLDGLHQRVATLDQRRTTLVGRRAQIEGLAQGIAPEATLVEPAVAPLRPDWPKPKLMGAFGFMLGAALALAVALWLQRRRLPTGPVAAQPAGTQDGPTGPTRLATLSKRN